MGMTYIVVSSLYERGLSLSLSLCSFNSHFIEVVLDTI